MDLRQVKSVIVLGGGTAGWISSFYMSKCFPDAKITVVESKAVGILGAGEGTFRNFKFFLDLFDLDVDAFMTATDATYKLGIEYVGWGGPQDHYFHYFKDRRAILGTEFAKDGAESVMAYHIANDQRVDNHSDFDELRRRNASQSELRDYLDRHAHISELRTGFHFDAHRVAAHLREEALKRPNIAWLEGKVSDVTANENGIAGLHTEDGAYHTADFFVDASGFRRLLIGETLKTDYADYSKYLLVNSALPFIVAPPREHPELTTQATALDNGWMWKIPTNRRLGCGYVYSRDHTDADGAQAEIERRLDREITPIQHIRFTPGAAETVLKKNCMAVGLAAGFLEPLEATSIAQTISQLNDFLALVVSSGMVVPSSQQKAFNTRTSRSYELVRDFLVLHYMGGRTDTLFWRDVAAAETPDGVLELLEIYKRRMPRDLDGWISFERAQIIFPAHSYYCVCGSLGLLDKDAAAAEVAQLDTDEQDRIIAYAGQSTAELQAS